MSRWIDVTELLTREPIRLRVTDISAYRELRDNSGGTYIVAVSGDAYFIDRPVSEMRVVIEGTTVKVGKVGD